MDERIAYYITRVVVDEETGCWLWQGKVRSDGYGVVCIDFKDRLIHQVFYEHFVGPRPRGSNLHHTCETKSCANYAHLTLLTVAEHVQEHPEIMRRLAASGRANARRSRAATHCQRGHAFTPENTYWTKQGWRRCRACASAGKRRA